MIEPNASHISNINRLKNIWTYKHTPMDMYNEINQEITN